MEDHNFEEFIKTVKSRNQLTLFIGAGINAGLIPLWDDLLSRLVGYCTKSFPDFLILDQASKKDVLKEISMVNPYEKASIVKHYLNQEYLPALREILYSNFNFKDLKSTEFERKYPFLFNVAKLSQNPIITSIVSYNYDEILSILINSNGGRPTACIFGSKSFDHKGNNVLPVYYIHGFVPLHLKIPKDVDSAIVLSQDEYFNFMINDQSWQTIFQLNLLMNTPCLFLGCSLSDLNMLRLLALAIKGKTSLSVFNLTINEYFQKGKSSGSANTLYNIKNRLFNEYGVKVINAGSSYNEIPKVISKIIKRLNNEN